MAHSGLNGKQIRPGAVDNTHIKANAGIEESKLSIDWATHYASAAQTVSDDLLDSTTAGKGANLVALQDTANVFTASTVEGALKELYDALGLVTGGQTSYRAHYVATGGESEILLTAFTSKQTLPAAFVVGNDSLELYVNGALQEVDLHYQEGANGDKITFDIGDSTVLEPNDLVQIKFTI